MPRFTTNCYICSHRIEDQGRAYTTGYRSNGWIQLVHQDCFGTADYGFCEGCDFAFRGDDLSDSERCSNCRDYEDDYEEDEDSPGGYYWGGCLETLVPWETLKDAPTGTVFGIELEAIGRQSRPTTELQKHWEGTSDGSLSHGGVEYRSVPVPQTHLTKVVRTFSEWSKKNKIKIDRSCGFHLHMNVARKDRTAQKLKKVMMAYMALEDMFFESQPRSRRSNDFCRKLGTSYSSKEAEKIRTMKEFWENYYKEKYGVNWRRQIPVGHYHERRYYWVNFHSLLDKGTIEIRLHSGTVNAKKILKWADIHSRILKWAMSQPEEKIALVGKRLKRIIGESNWRYLLTRRASFERFIGPDGETIDAFLDARLPPSVKPASSEPDIVQELKESASSRILENWINREETN